MKSHAQFDEVWYHQPHHPLALQLLYDLGVEPDKVSYSATGPLTMPLPSYFHLLGPVKPIEIPWLAPYWQTNDMDHPKGEYHDALSVKDQACTTTIATTNCSKCGSSQAPLWQWRLPSKWPSTNITKDFGITWLDMSTIYFAPDPYLMLLNNRWTFDPLTWLPALICMKPMDGSTWRGWPLEHLVPRYQTGVAAYVWHGSSKVIDVQSQLFGFSAG